MANHVKGRPGTDEPKPTPDEEGAALDEPAKEVEPEESLPRPRRKVPHRAAKRQPQSSRVFAELPPPPAAPADLAGVAALRTPAERRQYIAYLFSTGRYEGFWTTEQLAQVWEDLGPLEFSAIMSQAAAESYVRRGSDRAKRVVLLGKVERLFQVAVDRGELRAAAKFIELWMKLDGIGGETDLLATLASLPVWPLVAQVLQQRHPEALASIHEALTLEDAKKRAALAPITVQPMGM